MTEETKTNATASSWCNPFRWIPAVRWGVQGAYLAFLALEMYRMAPLLGH